MIFAMGKKVPGRSIHFNISPPAGGSEKTWPPLLSHKLPQFNVIVKCKDNKCSDVQVVWKCAIVAAELTTCLVLTGNFHDLKTKLVPLNCQKSISS